MKDEKVLKKSKIKKKALKNNKKSHLKKKVRKFFALLILSMVVLVVLATSPLFNIKSILVSGLTRYDTEQIIGKAGIEKEKNWYKIVGMAPIDWLIFRCSHSSQLLRDNFPYVENAVVRFVPLGKVKIEIVERIPKFLVRSDDLLIVIDKDGICLETVQPYNSPELPILENSTVKVSTLGKKIEFGEPYVMDNLKKLFGLIQLADQTDKNKIENLVTSVDLSKLDRAFIYLEARVKVNFGELSKITNYQIGFMKEVFFNNIKKQEKGVLDFTKNENPVFRPE